VHTNQQQFVETRQSANSVWLVIAISRVISRRNAASNRLDSPAVKLLFIQPQK